MNSAARFTQRLQVLPLVFVAVFFAWPVLTICIRYARIDGVVDVISDASLRNVWWFTFWQAGLSTVLTVVVGMPITWAISRHQFFFSRIIHGLVTIPFVMPAVVIAAGVRAVLPHASVLGILWAHVAFNVAVIVRIVGPRWALLDSTLEDTAADLGATPLRIFTQVVFPHIRSALRNAAAVVFLFCFTSFAVIAILGGISRRTIESEIFTQAVRLGNVRAATSLAIIQAIVVLCVVAYGTRSSSLQDITTDIAVQPRPLQRRGRALFPVYVAAYVPLLLVITPLIAVVLKSVYVDSHFTLNGFRWLFDGSTESVGVNIGSTLTVSLVFALSCAFIATLCALVIGSSQSHRTLLTNITALPLVASAVTLGLGLIITFDSWPYEWRSQRWLIPVIHAVIAVPLAIRVLSPAIDAIPSDLHNASSSLGAGPLRTWLHIDLPILRPSLMRAFGLAAAISIGEFGATSFLSRSGATTIPIAIGQLLSHPGDVMNQAAFALAALVVVILGALFAVA